MQRGSTWQEPVGNYRLLLVIDEEPVLIGYHEFLSSALTSRKHLAKRLPKGSVMLIDRYNRALGTWASADLPARSMNGV